MKYLVHFIHLHETSIIKAQGILWIRRQKHYKVQWILVLATEWIYQFNLKLSLNENKKKIHKEKRKTMKNLKKCECRVFFFDGETDDKCIFFFLLFGILLLSTVYGNALCVKVTLKSVGDSYLKCFMGVLSQCRNMTPE